MTDKYTYEEYSKLDFNEQHDILYGNRDLEIEYEELLNDIEGLPLLFNSIYNLSPNGELYECFPETWKAIRTLQKTTDNLIKELLEISEKISSDKLKRGNKLYFLLEELKGYSKNGN